MTFMHKFAGAVRVAGCIFALLLVSMAPRAEAQGSMPVSVAIGGRAIISYLPVILADRLGYFKAAGLDIEFRDFKGGSQSAQALVGGNADIMIGSYENVLLLRSKSLDIKSVAVLTTSPGAVIALKKDLAARYRSPADLKGLRLGVTAPGSSSSMTIEALLAKGNIPVASVSMVGIGAGPAAITAMKAGQLDGLSNFDPIISRLEQDGDVMPILDTRTPKDEDYLFGGPMATASVLTTSKFIERNRKSVVAFVSCIQRALSFLHHAPIEQIMQAIPHEFYASQEDAYKGALEKQRPLYSIDGILSQQTAENTYRIMVRFHRIPAETKLDIAATFDNLVQDRQ
jgi:NitT/TauT family transport system substrate-binding protein